MTHWRIGENGWTFEPARVPHDPYPIHIAKSLDEIYLADYRKSSERVTRWSSVIMRSAASSTAILSSASA
jgi:hypothetical protein